MNKMIVTVKYLLFALKVSIDECLEFHLFAKEHKLTSLLSINMNIWILANFKLLMLAKSMTTQRLLPIWCIVS